MAYNSDNAAMIAASAYIRHIRRKKSCPWKPTATCRCKLFFEPLGCACLPAGGLEVNFVEKYIKVFLDAAIKPASLEK